MIVPLLVVLMCGSIAHTLAVSERWDIPSSFYCYYCRNSGSNDECNRNPPEPCHPLSQACEVTMTQRGHRQFVQKKCINPNTCWDPNVQSCDPNSGSCNYCCMEPGCNHGIAPVEPDPPTLVPPTLAPTTRAPITNASTPSWHTTTSGLFCYVCIHASDNEACNQGPVYCHVLAQACEVTIQESGPGQVSIMKRCINPNTCWEPNVSHCDVISGRCSYCCTEPGCNQELLMPETTTPGTASPPIPGAGPAGPPGPAGPEGEMGDYGLAAGPGRPGLVGLPGYTGRPGIMGSVHPGESGIQGLPGDQGFMGPPGTVSPGDLKGPKGDFGDFGGSGAAGQPGEPGHCPSDCEQGSTPSITLTFSVFSSGVEQESGDFAQVPITQVLSNISEPFTWGGGIQPDTMDFIAPYDGLYVFILTAVAQGSGAVPLFLVKNNVEVGTTGRSDPDSYGLYPVGTTHAALELAASDSVSVRVPPGDWLSGIYRDPTDVTFNGILLAAVTNSSAY